MMNYENFKEENRKRIDQYKLGSNDGFVNFYPAYIQLEQTNKCNGKCIMCNHSYLGNRGAKDLDPQVIKNLEKIFPYSQYLMLNGDGEPLCAKNIVSLIKKYKSYGLKIGTNTNLTYIKEDLWECLDDFEFLNISCDAVNKETFELIRRGLSFDDFIKNLHRLNKTKANLRKNLDCVIMKENIRDLEQIVYFAKENKFSSLRFHMLGVNPLIDNYYDCDEDFQKFAKYKLKISEKLAKEIGIRIQIPKFDQSLEEIHNLDTDLDFYKKLIDKRLDLARKKYAHLDLSTDYLSESASIDDFAINSFKSNKHCQWAIERIYIDVRGNVSTCCFNVKKHMGNLLEKSFDEIWNGKEYREFRKIMAKGRLADFCRDCNWIIEGKF